MADVGSSKAVNLSRSLGNDFAPVWSQDGSRIAFVSDRDGNFEIYHMDADGADPVNLTQSQGDEFSPAWVPMLEP